MIHDLIPSQDVVGRLIPLGHILQPPRVVASGPPTLRSILGEVAELTEQLETVAEQTHDALERNEEWRPADQLDVFTQSSTREVLQKEFAFTINAVAHLQGLLASRQEVLGW